MSESEEVMRSVIRPVKVVIALVFYLSSVFGSGVRKLFRETGGGTLVVLNYHSVGANQRGKFQIQMEKLKQAGKPAFANLTNSLPDGGRHIAVTFDDGLLNVAENALPVLRDLGIPATLFIPVGYLGKLPGWIKDRRHKNAGEVLLTARQLKELECDLVNIGSHSVTHPVLPALPPEQIRFELSGSKSMLEDITGREVTSLAFPYNRYAPGVLEMAKQAGYARVFSNSFECPVPEADGFLTGRVDVSPDDWEIEYWLKLRGAYNWVPAARGIRQRLRGKF